METNFPVMCVGQEDFLGWCEINGIEPQKCQPLHDYDWPMKASRFGAMYATDRWRN